MKIYFAGISSNVKRLNYLKEFGANKLMLTYADIRHYKLQIPRLKNSNFDIFFDSGAFSLWRRGIKINIKDYCEYLKIHEIDKYIVLDKVGDHKDTMTNQKIMEDMGMKPIPVYHFNSPIENLYEICEAYPYVCLGGTVGAHSSTRIKFFTQIFEHFPKHKFHGLGLTDPKIIKLFPFYSVDSSTWLIAEKRGRIFDENGQRIKIPPEISDARLKFKNTIEFFLKIERESGEQQWNG